VTADNTRMTGPEEDSIEVENWCAGYRYADIRPLSDAEIAVIRDAARRHAWMLAWLAPAPVVGGVLLVLAMQWLPPAVWFTAVMLALLCGLSVWTLLVRDSWRSWATLSRDARGGEAWYFESPRVADAIGPDPLPLAVLPISLYAFEPGTLTLSEFPMSISEVAKGPSYAMRVPVAATSDAENAQAVVDFSRRTLNHSEQGEIEIAIRRLRWPGFWLLISPLWLAFVIFTFKAGRWNFSSDTVSSAVFTVLCVMGLARYFRGLALTIKMRRDLRTGWAITAPPKDSQAQDGPLVEEFLPHSRLSWTVNGSPAFWRNLKRGPLILRR
jgi:hypothetical protein